MRFATDPCPEEQAFRFQNGARARSLDEFRRALREAPPTVVAFHRDHYQHWVRDILQDRDLADRIQAEGQRAQNPEQLRERLDRLLAGSLSRPGPGSPGAGPAGGAAKPSGARRKR
jgi:hypothetical protein